MQLSTSVTSYHHYYKINAHKLFTIYPLQFLLLNDPGFHNHLKMKFTSWPFGYLVFVTVYIVQKIFTQI